MSQIHTKHMMAKYYLFLFTMGARGGVVVKVTNRQVAGSIPDGVNGIFSVT